jgi:F420 biosynthesis protein FbiB-like protein
MLISPGAAPSEASLADAVRERRSIRRFRDEPVPRALVEEVLQQAQWAPSPHNSQPWRFTVLFHSKDKRRLADAMGAQLAVELESDGLPPAARDQQVERSRERISAAPVVVLCSLAREGLVVYPDGRRNDLEFQMAVQSVGAVLQTVFLLAATRGLGSCWMAAPMYCPGVVRDVLSLPDEVVPQALVLLGYPAAPGKVRERRPFEEVVDLR